MDFIDKMVEDRTAQTLAARKARYADTLRGTLSNVLEGVRVGTPIRNEITHGRNGQFTDARRLLEVCAWLLRPQTTEAPGHLRERIETIERDKLTKALGELVDKIPSRG